MNAQISNLQTLTVALRSPSLALAHPARRQFVDRSPLQPGNLARFNKLLTKLCFTPLDSEAPTSVPFAFPSDSDNRADCVATVVARMLNDSDWQTAEDAIVPAHMVVNLVTRTVGASQAPDTWSGQIYHAAVIDAAWPRLIEEVDCYLDFCRIRAIEAGLRGCDIRAFAFNRADWNLARRAEARLRSHRREKAVDSYQAASATTHFRVC